MASIPEDDDVFESDSDFENEQLIRYQNSSKNRRRGSTGSVSLNSDSDEENSIERSQFSNSNRIESSKSDRKERVPDYMNLGGTHSTPFQLENFYNRSRHTQGQG